MTLPRCIPKCCAYPEPEELSIAGLSDETNNMNASFPSSIPSSSSDSLRDRGSGTSRRFSKRNYRLWRWMLLDRHREEALLVSLNATTRWHRFNRLGVPRSFVSREQKSSSTLSSILTTGDRAGHREPWLVALKNHKINIYGYVPVEKSQYLLETESQK